MNKILSYGLAERYRDATVGEVDSLKELARSLPQNPTVVNIGAGDRAISTLAILEERKDAVIYSIDIHAKTNEGHYLRKAGLPHQRVIRLLGKSQDIGKFWPILVDMVYVDGDHSYVAVLEDIEVWWPNLKRGGIMAFHDYVNLNGKPTQAGRAIDEKMVVAREKILVVDRIAAFLK